MDSLGYQLQNNWSTEEVVLKNSKKLNGSKLCMEEFEGSKFSLNLSKNSEEVSSTQRRGLNESFMVLNMPSKGLNFDSDVNK